MRTDTRTYSVGLFARMRLFRVGVCRRIREDGPTAVLPIRREPTRMNRRLRVLAGCLVLIMGLLAAPPGGGPDRYYHAQPLSLLRVESNGPGCRPGHQHAFRSRWGGEQLRVY